MRAMCEAQAPDTHDFDSVYVSPALDAANSAASVFDLIESRDPARAIEIAYWARDSVDMYVQEIDGMEPNTIDLEKRIAEHPLMRREIDRQRGDLGVVRQEQHPSRLRERFRAPRHGNLETTQSP
jgi:hypothetical protein